MRGHVTRVHGAADAHRALWTVLGIEYGLCLCGCGERTTQAEKTEPSAGRIAGEPVRYIRGHGHRKMPAAYVTEDRGYVTPCWIWQRSKNDDGYGTASGIKAHRLFYRRHFGVLPDGDLDHLCRVRDCVNPDHLEPVSHAENCRRGSRSKLSMDAARDIRERYAAGGISQAALGREYGVAQTQISLVVRGRAWT